jgi:triosephosphate isomerase
MSRRLPLIAGNWKMHKGPAEARAFAAGLLNEVRTLRDREVAVFPPFVSLAAVRDVLRGSPVAVGGQNCHWESKGAFTGEVAPQFLAELGCRYVLVGHSERRTLFGETDETCARKIRAALAAKLEPVFCCGEALAEREAGTAFNVIERQLGALAGLDPEDGFVVAYEPVWAIGTGRTASPEQAQEVHRFIREWLGRSFSPAKAAATRVLYGGSVKPDNAADLMTRPDIDGALVGGASLDLAAFGGIARFRDGGS